MRPVQLKHTSSLSAPFHVLGSSGNNIINHTFTRYVEATNDAQQIVGDGSVEAAVIVDTEKNEITLVTPVVDNQGA